MTTLVAPPSPWSAQTHSIYHILQVPARFSANLTGETERALPTLSSANLAGGWFPYLKKSGTPHCRQFEATIAQSDVT